MHPPFAGVDILVMLILDRLMAPEDVDEDTNPEDAPTLTALQAASGYSSTHTNASALKLSQYGFVRLHRSNETGWTQTGLFALTDDGRRLLARLFPPRPPR